MPGLGNSALALCRDCGASDPRGPAERCGCCGSPRLVAHPELASLAIAHLDCDAFYATVEKRDRPELMDRPVIVGGGHRGVVAACCYVARSYGVRSAMPMFKALRACPEAVVIRPDMPKYSAVGRQVRALMQELTPLVEPLSIDEAFIDLGNAEWPARALVELVGRIERELGITASVGLSYNKFLAKIASELDKPRGFAVIGRAESAGFLAAKPVALIWGVGPAAQRRLAADGIRLIGDLQRRDAAWLERRYGKFGRHLAQLARGQDARRVEPDRERKSVSVETTFSDDIADPHQLEAALHKLAQQLSERLSRVGDGAAAVTLKLKTADFRLITRRCTLARPTLRAEALWRAGADLLRREADGRRFRLLGIGADQLVPAAQADLPDLLDGAVPE